MTNHIYDKKIGLLQFGTVVNTNNLNTDGTIAVNIGVVSAGGGQKSQIVNVPYAPTLFSDNGLFIGSIPSPNTSVIVSQGNDNTYYFVSARIENKNKFPIIDNTSISIQSTNNSKINLNLNGDITLGSNNSNIFINTGSKNNPNTNLITFNFENENHLTEGSRQFQGVIKRDISPNDGFEQNFKLFDNKYDSKYKIIGLDPSLPSNNITSGSSKNPAFIEKREIIYEFQYKSEVQNDLSESANYGKSENNSKIYNTPNRRKSRADTLSLTQLEPNYLMETVKGTVVDIFGNILDLNRSPLPLGQDQNTIKLDKSTDKVSSYFSIRELERKSLAYHFELNAKKDFSVANAQTSTFDLLDIEHNTDYARIRSRLFIDIDKEGLVKANIPASSEKGNIPLLTRYENYSSFSSDNNGNPNQLLTNQDNKDIYLDSFAAPSQDRVLFGDGFSFSKGRGSIQLVDSDDKEAAPIDRITGQHIKHGLAHHDILQTCYALQDNSFINYQAGTSDITTIDINSIAPLSDFVSKKIIVSGSNSNAGGRSGQANLDGSVELSIGANTIDRQSLWLDLAGGSVMHFGRDKKNNSALIHMDGNLLAQVGGIGVFGDSRFAKLDNGAIGGVVDLRVFTNGGFCHLIRIDDTGISVMSPGNIAIHSKGNLRLSSDANIAIEGEAVLIQNRLVLKDIGITI